MVIIKPPYRPSSYSDKSIFLAGSIEMGAAVDWQKEVEKELSDIKDLLIYNPRRDDWNSSWEQSIDSPNFKGQVDWELDMLTACSIVMMYLDPATKSPISLMELGLYADTGKLIVCCPKGFYRKGNVDIVCERYRIPVVETLAELVLLTRIRLKNIHPFKFDEDFFREINEVLSPGKLL